MIPILFTEDTEFYREPARESKLQPITTNKGWPSFFVILYQIDYCL
jgi:hypothetical protein